MRASSSRAIRRVPTQKRAQEKYDAILCACAEVLREEGFERTTTAKVAARAGVGKGVLYQYFSNREALVATLVESEFDRLLSGAIDARPARADAPLLETARALLGMSVELCLENRKLLKVILSEVPGVFDLPEVRRIEERLAEFTHSLVPPGLAEKHPADLESKLYVLTNVIMGFIFRLVLVDPGPVTAEEITDELLTLLRGYLEGSGLGEWLSG